MTYKMRNVRGREYAARFFLVSEQNAANLNSYVVFCIA